jgi:tetratricopeptide (TPR) repeat protein
MFQPPTGNGIAVQESSQPVPVMAVPPIAEVFPEVTKQEPATEDVSLLFLQVEQYIVNNQLENAVDQLVEVLAKVPDHQKANSMMGAILLSLHQYQNAEDFLYSAVKASNWTDYNAIINLATVLKVRGDAELALKTLSKGYSLYNDEMKERNSTFSSVSSSATAVSAVSSSSVILSDDTSAVTATITGSDKSASFALTFGEIYRNLSKYDEASSWYLSAAFILQNDEQVWLDASTLLFPPSYINITNAEKVLLHAVQLNPNSSLLSFYLGVTLYETNRLTEAITFLNHAVTLNSDNIPALNALAVAYHSNTDYSKAFNVYNEASMKDSNNIDLLMNFARLLFDINRQDDGILILQKAAEIDLTNPKLIAYIKSLGLVVSYNDAPAATTAAATADVTTNAIDVKGTAIKSSYVGNLDGL